VRGTKKKETKKKCRFRGVAPYPTRFFEKKRGKKLLWLCGGKKQKNRSVNRAIFLAKIL